MTRNRTTVSENLKAGRYRSTVVPPISGAHVSDQEILKGMEIYRTEQDRIRALLRRDLEEETGLTGNVARETWAHVRDLYLHTGKLDKLVETYKNIAECVKCGGTIADGSLNRQGKSNDE